jgi:hypothetical protein
MLINNVVALRLGLAKQLSSTNITNPSASRLKMSWKSNGVSGEGEGCVKRVRVHHVTAKSPVDLESEPHVRP